MRRARRILAAWLVLTIAALATYAGSETGPQVKKLDGFVGTWILEGIPRLVCMICLTSRAAA
jgi:hypothetical protein